MVFEEFYVFNLGITLNVWSFFEERGRPELNTEKGPCFSVSPGIPQRLFCKRMQKCPPEAEIILPVLAKRANENDKDMCGAWGETKYSRLDLPH